MANEKEIYKQIGDDEEEEYVLLELDDCLHSNIQPNASYTLSIGEYEETVGTCYLFSESERIAPPEENEYKQASNSKEAPARSKEVKHLASVQKILKFRSISEDHQEHGTYLHNDN